MRSYGLFLATSALLVMALVAVLAGTIASARTEATTISQTQALADQAAPRFALMAPATTCSEWIETLASKSAVVNTRVRAGGRAGLGTSLLST